MIIINIICYIFILVIVILIYIFASDVFEIIINPSCEFKDNI